MSCDTTRTSAQSAFGCSLFPKKKRNTVKGLIVHVASGTPRNYISRVAFSRFGVSFPETRSGSSTNNFQTARSNDSKPEASQRERERVANFRGFCALVPPGGCVHSEILAVSFRFVSFREKDVIFIRRALATRCRGSTRLQKRRADVYWSREPARRWKTRRVGRK